MKKFLTLALAMAGALVLTACTNSNPTGGGNLDGEIGGEITISTFDSMTTYPLLQEAARLFMDANPGTVVRVETFAPMPIQTEDGRVIAGGGDARDYINMINTELMSGRGADILAMDILPFYEYARNGQLVNLLEFMQNDPNFNFYDYQTALFDSLTTDRGLFVFPMVYFFWFLTYNDSMFNENQQAQLMSESVFSFNRLLEISQPTESHLFQVGAFMQKNDVRGLFYQMFIQNYSHFIDVTNRQANFADGVFADMLTQAAAWERNGYIQPRGGSLYATVPSTTLMMAYIQGDSRMRDIFGMSNTPRLAGVMGSDNGEAMFSISLGFGINSNSQNQQTAWEFLRFLSNEAMRQVLTVNPGLPIHIGALEERAVRLAQGVTAEAELYTALVSYLTGQLSTSFELSTNVLMTDMVMAEAAEFFNGSRTADEVARTLQSRISLFLSE